MEAYPVFSSKLKTERNEALKGLIPAFILILIAVWSLLPVFWGSNYRIEKYFYRLTIDIYNLDTAPGAILGPIVTQYLLKSMQDTTHFTFRVMNSTGLTFADFENGVVNEHSWGTIVINSNATTALTSTLTSNTPYSPNSISIFVASARFYQVVLEYLLPFLNQLLTTPLLEASQAATAQFLSTTTPATSATFTSNQIAAISQPYSSLVVDVRPIHFWQWSGSAPLEAGNIYYTIFAFHVSIILLSTVTSQIKMNGKLIFRLFFFFLNRFHYSFTTVENPSIKQSKKKELV